MKASVVQRYRVCLGIFFIAVGSCSKDVTEPTPTPPPKPVITSISPTSGSKADEVVIAGNNFGTDKSKIKVFFNGSEAEIKTITNISITVLVPPKSGTGSITITMSGSTITGPSFIYLPMLTVSTLAGDGTFGNDDGTGESATFHMPLHLATDWKGNVFVVDRSNANVRKITPAGVVTTVASGFDQPNGICIDASNTIYVSDACKIKKITTAGVVSVVAGTQPGSCGFANGSPSDAMFSYPYGLCTDKDGNIYVAERGNHAIRKISGGNTTTFAGGDYGDEIGNGSIAKFRYPHDVAIDATGNVFVLDQSNNKIKKITPAGEVTNFAGSIVGHKDGVGASAQIKYVNAICVGLDGNIYFAENTGVSDPDSIYVRMITPAGEVKTLFGNLEGHVDGAAADAKLGVIFGIEADENGALYLTEEYPRIRKISIE